MKMIEAVKLQKSYKQKDAVKSINFHIEQGEILGFLGPNGAGKSTTISMISTLVPPTKGDVVFNGKSILSNPKVLRKVLGVVPQDIALYPDLSGYENLEFFGQTYGLRGKKLKERIEEVLKYVGLQERANEKVNNYSGGMKRRINIGAALLHKPKLLIMDEPTVGIDPQSRNHILETVKRLNKEGMTILYTSHYMEEVEFLCDRIYIMDDGEIIAQGTKDELKASISNQDSIEIDVEMIDEGFTETLKQHPKVEKVSTMDNAYTIVTEEGRSLLTEIFKMAEDHHVMITSVNVKSPTLEDVFLHLTGRALRS